MDLSKRQEIIIFYFSRFLRLHFRLNIELRNCMMSVWSEKVGLFPWILCLIRLKIFHHRLGRFMVRIKFLSNLTFSSLNHDVNKFFLTTFYSRLLVEIWKVCENNDYHEHRVRILYQHYYYLPSFMLFPLVNNNP